MAKPSTSTTAKNMSLNFKHEGAITGAGAPNYLNGVRGVYVITIGGTEYALVVSAQDDALVIFDVSTPASPSLVGSITGVGAPNYLQFATSVFAATIGGTEYALVVSAQDDALGIFDISTPGSPSLAGTINGIGAPNYLNGAWTVYVATIGGTEYAFVASLDDDALTIFDVSTPGSPSHTGVLTGAGAPNYLNGARGVFVYTIGGTEYAFVVSEYDNSLSIIDVSTPASPSLTGLLTGAGAPNYLAGAVSVHVAAIGGIEYAFVTSITDNALSIIDVSTPASPSPVGLIAGAGYPNFLNGIVSVSIVTIDNIEYAVVGSKNEDALSIFDVSDPTNPTLVGTTGAITGAGAPFYLDDTQDSHVATIGGSVYVLAAGSDDNSLTIFSIAEPTAITSTVGTDGGLRDYTSLSSWESDKQRNLVLANETETAECYNDGVMTNNVTIAGWTTDANRWIKVYTPTAERHLGTLGTGFRYNGGASLAIYIQVPNVTIEGLSIKTTASGNYCIQTDMAIGAKGSISFSHNLLEGNGIMLLTHSLTSGFTFYVRNNMFIGWNSGARVGLYGIRVQINNANIPCYLYSNTLFGYSFDGFGFAFNHPICRVKNCIAVNCGTYDFRNPTYVHGDSQYNGSSAPSGDADEAPGANSIYSMVAADSFINVTGSSENLHTKNASSDQFQAGTDLSADADLPFSDDIDGETRGLPWDMGADNNLAAVAATAANSITHIIMQMMKRNL